MPLHLLLPFVQASIIPCVIPRHHEILEVFIFDCSKVSQISPYANSTIGFKLVPPSINALGISAFSSWSTVVLALAGGCLCSGSIVEDP